MPIHLRLFISGLSAIEEACTLAGIIFVIYFQLKGIYDRSDSFSFFIIIERNKNTKKTLTMTTFPTIFESNQRSIYLLNIISLGCMCATADYIRCLLMGHFMRNPRVFYLPLRGLAIALTTVARQQKTPKIIDVSNILPSLRYTTEILLNQTEIRLYLPFFD